MPLTNATPLSLLDQVAVAVKSCVWPSLKVPIALYCCVCPRGSVNGVGDTAIDWRTGTPGPSETTRLTADNGGSGVPATGDWLMRSTIAMGPTVPTSGSMPQTVAPSSGRTEPGA